MFCIIGKSTKELSIETSQDWVIGIMLVYSNVANIKLLSQYNFYYDSLLTIIIP